MAQAASVQFLLRQAAAAAADDDAAAAVAAAKRPVSGSTSPLLSSVNDQNNAERCSPLHAAALGGSVECVELLVKHGGWVGLRREEYESFFYVYLLGPFGIAACPVVRVFL